MSALSWTKSVVTTALVMRGITASRPCADSRECLRGQYCVATVCQPCYNCTRYYMRAVGECSKSLTECGDCLPGYEPSNNELEGCITPKSSTLPYWPALLAAAVAVVLFLIIFLVRHIIRKQNTDVVHARPSLNGDHKTNPTAPPPEERLLPTHLEGQSNGYQPSHNERALESQDDTPLLVTPGMSPPPYFTVFNEIRASSHPGDAVARTDDEVITPDQPSQNGSNPVPHNVLRQGPVTGNEQDDANCIPENHSDDAPRLARENGNARISLSPPTHLRIQKGHPKDTRISRENEIRQRARKYNNPIYDNDDPEHTPPPAGLTTTPEWLQDDDTLESGWSPHAPASTAAVAAPPPGVPAADTYAFSNINPLANGSDATGGPAPCVRVTTRARADDDAPPTTGRRLAADNNRATEGPERALVIRGPGVAGAAPSPPASGDDLTPEDGARRPVYTYNVINIQPELSIIAKIK